jgi:hypothetical protein
MRNWTFRPLNIASRLVLLKSVLQALPTYLFTALAAPKKIIKAIRMLQRNFLWQGVQPKKKWALVNWDRLCMPKSQGRAGNPRPGQTKSNDGSQNLVAVAEKSVSSMGTAVAAQVCPSHTRRPAHQAQQLHTWLQHLEHCLAKSHSGSESRFWEIKDGGSALFWQDSWQQLKPLDTLEELTTLKRALHQPPL